VPAGRALPAPAERGGFIVGPKQFVNSLSRRPEDCAPSAGAAPARQESLALPGRAGARPSRAKRSCMTHPARPPIDTFDRADAGAAGAAPSPPLGSSLSSPKTAGGISRAGAGGAW